MFFPFITGKNFTFRIVTEIIFAAWLILALTDKAYRPKKSWILYSLTIFVGVMALADIFSANPFKSFWSNYERMEGWVTLAHLLAYFIVMISVLAKEKLWDAFFQTSLGVNLTVVLYSILQTAHLLVINQGGTRTDATLGNATYLAVYALFNIFIAALFLVRTHDKFKPQKNLFIALGFNAGFFLFMLPLLSHANLSSSTQGAMYVWAFMSLIVINLGLYLTVFAKQERTFLAFVIVLDIITLFNTATRGAIIGFIFGVAIAGILLALFEKKDKFVRNIALTFIIGSVVLVAGFLALRNTNFVKNNQVLARFASISLTEKTTLSRFTLWKMSLQGFAERPILGWGQESFNYVFNAHYNPELYNQEQWFDRTHNVIFDWLIAGGILGLGMYLAFFFAILYYIWKTKNATAFTLMEKALLTGLLAAYFIHNLFVFDNITSYLLFVAIAAYVHHRTNPKPELEHMHAPVANQMAVPVVLVGLVFALYAVNVPSFLTARTLIEILSQPQSNDLTLRTDLFKKAIAYNGFANQEVREQLFSFAGQVAGSQQSLSGKQALLDFTNEQIKKQAQETPNDARIYMVASSYFIQAGDYKNAMNMLMTAHKLSPQKQSIDFSIAGVYMVQQDYTDAYSWMKQAYELYPDYTDARLEYAATAIYTNNFSVADELLSGLPTSTISANNDILQAYYTTKKYTRLVQLWEDRVKQKEISQDSDLAQSYVSLAAAYLLVNNKTGAIAELNKAIAIAPDFKAQGEEFIKQIQSGKALQ